MEIELITDITIGGQTIKYVMGFHLTQAFNTHHYFELRFNHDALGVPGMVSMDSRRNLLGKTLAATFGRASGAPQHFLGVVTQVSLEQRHGYHGVVVAKGYSATVLLERGLDLGSYYRKPLADIVKLACRDIAGNDLQLEINPVHKAPINHLLQFGESDFEFLNRLSAEYREWFYYDGTCLHFGKSDKQEEVKVVYGRDLQHLEYGIRVEPLRSKQFAYDMPKDTLLQADAEVPASGMSDLVHAAGVANTIYSKRYHGKALRPMGNNGDLSNLVKNQGKARVSNLLHVVGRSDQPAIGVGKIVEITTSIRQELNFVTQSLGKFLITHVVHEIEADGRYHNVFEAIPSDSDQLPLHEYPKPQPTLLLAEVYDHADPLQLGRVRVQFKWPNDQNDPTDWLRVMSPDAGSSPKVPKNRGILFVPEKGDQVLVGFEEGNLNLPLVMGSLFHGKNAGGGGKDNMQKGISTKSGHAIRLDDNAGVVIQDKTELNYVNIDGKDTIVIHADKRIHLQAGKVQILIDGETDTITLQAKHVEMKVADHFSVKGDGKPTRTGEMIFGNTFDLISKNSLALAGEEKVSLNGRAIGIAGEKTSIEGNPVNINS